MKGAPSDDGAPAFDILGKRRLHDGFVKLDRYEVRQPLWRGGYSPVLRREVVFARAAVAVLCYDPQRDAVVLVEQQRLPAAIAGFESVQTEIVAGLIETGETPEAVARREVREETGLDILGPLVPIARTLTTPGHSTETVQFYCGRVDARKAPAFSGRADEAEDIKVLTLACAEFERRVRHGLITNGFTLIAGLWFLGNRLDLRASWAAAAP